jgi:putative membrane protein
MPHIRILRSRPAAFLLVVVLVLAAGVVSGAKRSELAASALEAANAAAAVPTSAEIAAIVFAVNTIDIKNAELANARSNNLEVRDFANRMIAEHTSVNKAAADLAKRLNLTPQTSPTSLQLTQNADVARAILETKDGAEFDRAYIDNEVGHIQAVIALLDQTIIPGTGNPGLMDLLVGMRPTFIRHLDHAKAIQAELSAS